MSIADDTKQTDQVCLVCGKSLEHGGGFARLRVSDHMIALCCPLCLETYQKNTTRYAGKLECLLLGVSGTSLFTGSTNDILP